MNTPEEIFIFVSRTLFYPSFIVHTHIMPSLLSLSNELLLHIASYFKYHGDINSFMQITGRLYYLLRAHLYCHGIDRDKSSALEWAAEHGMESAVQRMIYLGAMSETTIHCGLFW